MCAHVFERDGEYELDGEDWGGWNLKLNYTVVFM